MVVGFIPTHRLDGYESLWDMSLSAHVYEDAKSTGNNVTLFLQFWSVPP